MAEVSAGCPRGFYCEHTPSKARVYALVRHDAGPEVLSAVLTVEDKELAQRAARVLNEALDAVPGAVLHAEIEQVGELLPTAPRASFTQALGQLRSGTWPAPVLHGAWPELDEKDESSESPRRLIDQFARTPQSARLAAHAGPVMRLGRLLELHVHDAPRVLTAACAMDWEPEDDEELDDDDHLLDAVMWMADEPVEIPDVDVVTEKGSAHQLPPSSDEVADWSPKPITFNFGRGWLLRGEESDDPGADEDDEDEPRVD